MSIKNIFIWRQNLEKDNCVGQLRCPLFSRQSQDVVSQFVRFGISGIFTAGIDFLFLIFLVEIISIHYFVASALAFTLGVILNYFISRSWVFGRGKFHYSAEFVGFFVASSIGLFINQAVLWMLTGCIAVDYRMAKIISICVVSGWNFVTKRYFIFKQ
jgi:putative flippase GtrA